jgi:large subunit ribosomal protein L4
MANVSVFNMEGNEVGSLELSDKVFGADIKENLVHQAVVTYLANQRQGTQSTLTRSEVSGGGKKPWRQKGTGHARQGSIRAPQWKGGGVVFAPKPRDYDKKMNKKERRAALFSVLTDKVNTDNLIALDDLKFDEIKTKSFAKVLDCLKAEKALVVLDASDKNVILSGRNIPTVKVITTDAINTYDVLKYEKLIATEKALKKIEEVYA